jgi:XRE family transcriptional regulator, aerobic/anaerobic benzoate catabolism transcriptional regulator
MDPRRALGERVKALRAAQGTTRADVATASGLSLRFLSEVEAGRANPSLTSLHDLAHALGIDVVELVRTDPAPRPIALLGLRGAGKSTVGPQLAKQLGWSFVEVDREIEAEAGMPLSSIFELHGEEHYRALEKRVLSRLLAAKKPAVLATGGGVVTHPESYGLLRAQTRTVWLKATPDAHWERVIAQGDRRPMARRKQARAELDALFRARAPLYAQADVVVDTTAVPVQDVCRRILLDQPGAV